MKISERYAQYESYAGDRSHIFGNNPFFEIFWSPDIFCNYKCSYCWPGSNSPHRKHLPIDVLIKGIRDLKQKILFDLNIKNISLVFSGGEPTLLPNFLDLVRAYSEDNYKNQSLGICTNLTQGKKWWGNFFEASSNLSSISISSSWHRENIRDIDKERNKFLEINHLTKMAKRNFNISIVVPPSQFDDVYIDALFFRKNKIPTLIRVERKTINGKMLQHPDYNDDQIDNIIAWNDRHEKEFVFIHKEGNEIKKYSNVEQAIALGETNYFDWNCFAGTNSVIINPDGFIRRGWGCSDKPLGNIQNEYNLSITPQKCITQRCGCSSDMRQPKVKTSDF